MTLEIMFVLSLFYLTGSIVKCFQSNSLSPKNTFACCICMVMLPVAINVGSYLIKSYYPLFAEKVLLTEDGLIETATVGMYLWAAATLFPVKNKKLFDYFILAITIFIAGEEISWGQRILGFETSEWWKTLNPQEETTFHNLVIGGLFVWFCMIIPGILYLLMGKYLINKFAIIKKLTSLVGIPTPRYIYGVVFLAILSLNFTIDLSDNNEVMEVCLSILMVWYVQLELAPNTRPRYFRAKQNTPTENATKPSPQQA